MDDQDLRDAADLRAVAQMMDSRGWAVALVSLNADRERIIRIVAGAESAGKGQKHGWEYYQGLLCGFQRAVDIFENLKLKYEEVVAISKREQEERQNA